VNGVASHKMLSFLDTYSGFNQIPMNRTNWKKTTFLTKKVNYYYEVMPFRLKNAGQPTRD